VWETWPMYSSTNWLDALVYRAVTMEVSCETNLISPILSEVSFNTLKVTLLDGSRFTCGCLDYLLKSPLKFFSYALFLYIVIFVSLLYNLSMHNKISFFIFYLFCLFYVVYRAIMASLSSTTTNFEIFSTSAFWMILRGDGPLGSVIYIYINWMYMCVWSFVVMDSLGSLYIYILYIYIYIYVCI